MRQGLRLVALASFMFLGACRSDRISWLPFGVRGDVGVLVTGNRLFGSPVRCCPFHKRESPILPGRLTRYTGVSPVFAFAANMQPTHRTPVWSFCRDTVNFTFADAIVVPVHIHVTRGDFETVAELADGSLEFARRQFLKERVGVRFELQGEIHDHTAEEPFKSAAIYDQLSCGHITLGASPTHDLHPLYAADKAKDGIHIWFVGKVTTWSSGAGSSSSDQAGSYCGISSPRSILIGIAAAEELMAHELGHVVFGDHSEGHVDLAGGTYRRGFDATNIMASNGGSAREWLSEGQVLRGHYAHYSLLNELDWLSDDGTSLRVGRHVIPKMDPWDTGTDGGEQGVGEYPPACWRIWPDGLFRANTAQDSVDDPCVEPELAVADAPELTPRGFYADPPDDRTTAEDYDRVLRALNMLWIDCGVAPRPELESVLLPPSPSIEQVFTEIALSGPTTQQRRFVREHARRKAVAARNWLSEQPLGTTRPSAVKRLTRRSVDEIVAAKEAKFAEDYRIAAIRALAILDTGTARTVIEDLRDARGRVGTAAQDALNRTR